MTLFSKERAFFTISVIFFLSGATALIYQVAWMRHLILFFGNDVYATAILLSAFMGGISLGSFIAGRYADRLTKPIFVYGIVEVFVGLYALAFPEILASFTDIYRSVYQGSFEDLPYLYQGFRFTVVVLVLLPPTVLLGATLPLVIRQFADNESSFGKNVGFFYALNTFGALCGTLLAGFVLLPIVGLANTTIAAVVVNVLIGVLAILYGLEHQVQKAANTSKVTLSEISLGTKQRAILAAIFLSGLGALALEVVWVRILVQSFSATVYAFSIMLGCFLFGIFFGSHLVSKKIDQFADPIQNLIQLEKWLAGSVAVMIPMVYFAPDFFGEVLWRFGSINELGFTFGSIMAQFLVASILIIGPTTLLGATIPVAAKAFLSDIEARSNSVAMVYAFNTAGAVIGALVGGFLFLPLLGHRLSLLAVAIVFALAALVLIRATKSPETNTTSMIKRSPVTMLPYGFFAIGLVSALTLPVQTVVNFNLQKSKRPDVIYHSVGSSLSVDLVRTEDGNIIMMVNGNIEADTTLLQRRHFVLKAVLPALLSDNPANAAIVGLGLGITTKTLLDIPQVEHVRLVELSPEMINAHHHQADLLGNILTNSKLSLRIDDGRNFMAMSDERFDMISTDPIHPRVTGVGQLYTREYYESIRARLKPGGIVTQWMPMYHISKESFDVAMRTFVDVFPHGTFWYVRGHGLFVASTEPSKIDFKKLAKNFNTISIRSALESIEIDSPHELVGHLLMDEFGIAEYLASTEDRRINTDDNAYLEYHTPFEFLGRTMPIITGLIPFSNWDSKKNISEVEPGDLTKIINEFEVRKSRLIDELGEPIK